MPGLFARLDDVRVGLPDPGAEFVLPQVAPDGTYRVQLRGMGGQGQHGDVVRHQAMLVTYRLTHDAFCIKKSYQISAGMIVATLKDLAAGVAHALVRS